MYRKQDDYLMKQVDILSLSASKALFFKSKPLVDEKVIDAALQDDLFTAEKIILMHYLGIKGINFTEDYLFTLEENYSKEQWLELGEIFYDQISQFSNEELTAENFSREEIQQGLIDLKAKTNK